MNFNFKNSLFLFLYLSIYFHVLAQNNVKIVSHQLNLVDNHLYSLNTLFKINGLTVKAPENFDFNYLKLIINNNDTISFSKDEHLEKNQSNLILFNEETHFKFISKIAVKLTLFFQYVPKINVITPTSNNKRNNCQMPSNIIDQQIWRQGLNAPIPGREATKTHHCIIHHSASNNSQTDYTQLVRSFYVQHTQINGWDDIAYNYLVAPNGSIYAGRDPEKTTISQDNVLGAHFCSKNANTMGICLIGNYELILPSDTLLYSLIELLKWKFVKDTLNPKAIFNHPYNIGLPLESLAGHKQGCATTCPGIFVFTKLDSLRNVIHQKFKQCLPTVSIKNSNLNLQNGIYPNPSYGYINVDENIIDISKPIEVYNSEGKIISLDSNKNILLKNGLYIFKYTLKEGAVEIQKITVMN